MRMPALLRLTLLSASAALAMTSCAIYSSEDEAEDLRRKQEAEKRAAQLPQFGNPLLANKGDLNAVNMSVATEEELEQFDNGAEGDLVFTNPDDIEASSKDINALFENRSRGNTWGVDYNAALRLARREERPMLLWFHDSVASPKSNLLGQNVLNTRRFDTWCRDRVVRVLIDSGEQVDELADSKPHYTLGDIRAMGNRFGVARKPAVVVISMSGKPEIVFDGVDDSDWAAKELSIYEAIERAEQNYDAYKESLRSKGFRDWQRPKGKGTVFGKLHRYDREDKRVYLRHVGGRISSMRWSAMSEGDRAYVTEKVTHKPD